MLTSFDNHRKTALGIAFFIAAIFTSLIVSADRDAEREALTKLIQEIELLMPLIKRAEGEADPEARIKFQYPWLRQDLNRIKSGIEDHLRGTTYEPRTYPPIRGEYTQ